MRPEGSPEGPRRPLELSLQNQGSACLVRRLVLGRCLPVGSDPPHTTGGAGAAQGHQDLVLGSVASRDRLDFPLSSVLLNLPSPDRNCLLTLTTTQITN